MKQGNKKPKIKIRSRNDQGNTSHTLPKESLYKLKRLTDLSLPQWVLIISATLFLITLSIFLLTIKKDYVNQSLTNQAIDDPDLHSYSSQASHPKISKTWFRKNLDQYKILSQGIFSNTQSPNAIFEKEKRANSDLSSYNIDFDEIPVYKIHEGSRYIFLQNHDQSNELIFIFEVGPYEFWEITFSDLIQTRKFERKVIQKQFSYAAILKTNLKVTLDRLPLDGELSKKIDQALAWTIDLFHLSPGSKIKLLYDATLVDGEMERIDTLQAVWVETNDEEHYAFYFHQDTLEGYFNLDAFPMKTTFLKAPIPYTTISSYFGERLHPIAQKNKFHFGTDYVAKAGTPIHAVADGEVVNATFREHNGYYVRLKHHDGYESFYLHMQRGSFPKGLESGTRIKQGDILGRVGQTGDATGPHVCFHFRHRGKPVNPEEVKLSRSTPIPIWALPTFFEKRDQLKAKLDEIQYFE